MTQLLTQLNSEVSTLVSAGGSALSALVEDTDSILVELRSLEAELLPPKDPEETDLATDSTAPVIDRSNDSSTEPSDPSADTSINPSKGSLPESLLPQESVPLSDSDFKATLDKITSAWYKSAIGHLKSYNTQLSRFSKNIVTSPKFHVSLDDAYSFPLQLNPFPVKEVPFEAAKGHVTENSGAQLPAKARARSENRRNLLKSIVLHLLKIGHGSLVHELLDDFQLHEDIDAGVLLSFSELNAIVDDVKRNHRLDSALAWLASKSSRDPAKYERISFKFHMLQFVLLLAGTPNSPSSYTIDSALAAYQYAKGNFPPFVKDYINEISPVITLLLFKSSGLENDSAQRQLLRSMIHQTFSQSCESGKHNTKETQFVAEILANFDSIHSHQQLFYNLANEFVAEFCADLALSSESSLFQAVLAGFVNLPNFHRYSCVQQRFSRKSVSDQQFQDLPFQLPDRNQFLFSYHPIFICPVSKEQLMPLVSTVRVSEDEIRDRKRKSFFVSANEILQPPSNPVVVFEHCRHLALKDSVRHLTKGGAEVFKCHYCYKKHKLSEVSDAYFINL